MKINVTSITYNTDGDDPSYLINSLPQVLKFTLPISKVGENNTAKLKDIISDLIAEETGWLTNDFTYTIIGD